jgi:hypothetical protein
MAETPDLGQRTLYADEGVNSGLKTGQPSGAIASH